MAQPALRATAQSGFGAGQRQSRRRTLWIPALICALLLGIEIYALVHGIDTGDVGEHGGRSVVATYESGKNQVRQKTAGTIIWNSPSAGQTLYQQDAIATMPDSEAIVKFADNSEMIVESDSLIVFEQAQFAKGGAGGKITARLVRGSVRRKNSGPMDLIVNSYRLSDPRGGAIFRVTYQSQGIEVTVESGGLHFTTGSGQDSGAVHEVAANQTLVVKAGAVSVVPTTSIKAPSKLPSPVLEKPTIKIREIKTDASPLDRFLDLCEALTGINEARASSTPQRWRVEIHFAWDAVPGASSYLIQIATDPSFQNKIVETTISTTVYDYSTLPPKKPEQLYMRVAGVDPQGNVGDFSPLEQIHIRSLAEISGASHEVVSNTGTQVNVVPIPPQKKHRHKKHKHAVAQHPPVPSFPKAFMPKKRIARIEVSYGVTYQSRSFSGSDLPTTVSSSGFVPLLLRAEYVAPKFRAGGSYLAEVANSGSSGELLQNGRLGVPLYRAWFLFEKPFSRGLLSGWTGGIGPYLTDSSKFSWEGSILTDQTQLLVGALAAAVKELPALQWRAELGIVGLGSFGADAGITARKWLFLGHRWFGELGAQARVMSIETSYGGTLAFGATF